MIVYSGASIAGQLPYDICFPPRARLLSDAPGARAAYAADDRVAVVTDGTLQILADDPELDAPGEVIATLPCPGHDEVFTVRYGHSVLKPFIRRNTAHSAKATRLLPSRKAWFRARLCISAPAWRERAVSPDQPPGRGRPVSGSWPQAQQFGVKVKSCMSTGPKRQPS